tara:strand:+ start:228 stop:551 length:324 start_codon:yes stop_codon:yes gene_type:complete
VKDKEKNKHHDALLGSIMQVEWEDAWIDTEDHLLEEAEKLKPVLRSSVGYLVADNENEIILSTDRYHSKHEKKYVNSVMVIPKGMVTRYWEIIDDKNGAEFDGPNNS